MQYIWLSSYSKRAWWGVIFSSTILHAYHVFLVLYDWDIIRKRSLVASRQHQPPMLTPKIKNLGTNTDVLLTITKNIYEKAYYVINNKSNILRDMNMELKLYGIMRIICPYNTRIWWNYRHVLPKYAVRTTCLLRMGLTFLLFNFCTVVDSRVVGYINQL